MRIQGGVQLVEYLVVRIFNILSKILDVFITLS
jgi:hypothetical protein